MDNLKVSEIKGLAKEKTNITFFTKKVTESWTLKLSQSVRFTPYQKLMVRG